VIAMMRTPFVVMVVLAVALFGLWAAGGGEEESGSAATPTPTATPTATPPAASIPVIAKRVADIRGLAFDTVPEPAAVTPEQAKREGLADLDRSYPEREQRADEEVLKLLGLIAPAVKLRDVSGETFSQGVAGYYDPRSKRLRIVKGTATGSRVLTEMVLSHELTHALEDQRFHLRLESGGSDDRALARLAMVEGTASWVMERYVKEHFTPEEALGGTLGAAFADTGSLPAFLQAQLVFPYTGGQAFIEALRERAGDRWQLVDLAERSRAPASTEQVMHPDKYVRAEAPRRVPLRPHLPGFERVRSGVLGEFQTRELLATAGGGGSGEAAAGWGGDAYQLWQHPDAGDCRAPCRGEDVLVMRWVWDTPRDEREFERKLRQWVKDGLRGRRQPGVAVVRRGGAVTLALAPDPATARRAASSPGP
jgi:hypothetical protein